MLGKKSRVFKAIGVSPPTTGMNCIRIPGNYGASHGPFPGQVPNVPLQLPPPAYFHGPAGSNERYAGVRNPFMPHGSAPPTISNVPFGAPHQFRPSGPLSPNLGQKLPERFLEYQHVDKLPSRMPQFHPPQPHPNHNPNPFSGFSTEARPQFMQPSLTTPPLSTSYPKIPPLSTSYPNIPPPSTSYPNIPPPSTSYPNIPPMSPLGAPTGVPPPQFNAKIDVPRMDFKPTVKARANEWSKHFTPDGNPYYYNAQTKVSVWEKPAGYEDMQKSAVIETTVVRETPTTPVKMSKVVRPELVRLVKAKETKTWNERIKKKDQPRPVSSHPVAGTPWCVVWTGNNRVFFYNPSIKHSTWARPRELFGRIDVDELVRNCPETVKQEGNWEAQTETPTVRSVTRKTNKALFAEQICRRKKVQFRILKKSSNKSLNSFVGKD